MLKHVPSFMDAELLWVLAAMGHGDELVVVDRNFPAQSVAMETQSGKLITLGGMDAPTSIGGISAGLVEGMPIDDAVALGQRASALCVTRHGAQPSIPYRREIA